MRIGVIVIHGVAPHPRYEIQDAFGEALCTRLNQKSGAGWRLGLRFIPFTKAEDPESVRVTIDRVESAAHQIDVLEAYWSPIDKHRTNPASVAGWILKTIFVPLNNAARFPGWPWKALFDVAYIVTAIALAVAALGAAFWFGGRTYATVAHALGVADVSFIALVMNPTVLFDKIWFGDAMLLLAAAAGVICAAQAASASIGAAFVRRRPHAAAQVRPNRWAVLLRIAGVGLIGAVLMYASAFSPLHTGEVLGVTVWWFAIAVLLLQLASSIGSEFLTNRVGDVQIYTVGDENSAYFAYREQIRTRAEQILLDTIHRKDGDRRYYDSIVVAAHSLGTTIGMDALLRVHEIHEATTKESGNAGVADEDWNRIRAFITFGTALEKTKYFFDAIRPTFSSSREQWDDELYGHLFTPQRGVLRRPNVKPMTAAYTRNDAGPGAITTNPATAHAFQPQPGLGIYWLNLTYWNDCIANEIESYRSCIAPRSWSATRAEPEVVAENHLLPPPVLPSFTTIFPHGYYLADENFWIGQSPAQTRALDVFLDLIEA